MIEQTCYYCGLSTNEKDHVIPRNMLKMIKDLDIETRNKIMGKRILIIPSCRERNSLLSASYQNSLKQRKQELKRQIKKWDKQEEERVEKICSTEEIQKLYKKRKKLQKKSNKLYEETEKIEEDTDLIYLNEGSVSPIYTNYDDGYWENDRRNIRKETLNGIKRGLGIKNLSLLKASEIEEVVEKLIKKKLNDNKEYQEKIEERETISETI